MQSPRNVRARISVFSWKRECMMRLISARAAIALGCTLLLSACDTEPTNQVGYGGYEDSAAAIGAASATLIAATIDPCKLAPIDLFWRQHGGREVYEHRCGHLASD